MYLFGSNALFRPVNIYDDVVIGTGAVVTRDINNSCCVCREYGQSK